MLLAVKTVKSDWCVSIRLLLVKKFVGLLLGAEHHLQTNHRIDWDSAKCITYSTNYYQQLTLESWFTYLEQTTLNRCQQLPAPYKRLIDNNNETDKQ